MATWQSVIGERPLIGAIFSREYHPKSARTSINHEIII